jgi:hypothetical protein
VTVQVYPSKIEGEPLETHQTRERMTVEGWLLSNVKGYEPRESPPISIEVNGRFVDPEEWALCYFGPSDCVRIYPEAKGFDPITVALIAVTVALVAATVLLQPSLPKQHQQGASGDNLDQASLKGNKIKINSPIREVSGTRKIYPDYLIPLHRYFKDKRTQVVETHLSFGKGEFDIPPSQILIGDTPLISLGDGAAYQIYQPGESVAADARAVWWHSAPEIGATSTGTAGLDLSTTVDATPTSSATSYVFSGSTVTVPAGGGSLPDDWESGMLVRIESPRAYTVIDGGAGRDIISGPLAELGPFAGMSIEIVGDNEGLYTVETFTPGTGGSASTITGNAAPSRYDFHVTPASFTITRAGQSWAVNLTTNAINLAGLVSAINTQLGAAPLIASSSGGFLRISEKTPFTGQPINRVISADATTVFGASPVAVTGAATTTDQMTLNYDGGAPANGLQVGTVIMGISYAGMLYRLTSASTSVIAVERLTDTGATDGAWTGFAPFSSSQALISLDSSTRQGGWLGPFAACPDGEVTDRIELDFFFPSGLIKITSKGSIRDQLVTVEAQYRRAGTSDPWLSFSKTYAERTKDQIGFTEAINLPSPIRPEVRVRRIGAESTSISRQDAVQWYGLRSKLQAPTSYAGVTTMTLYVEGGGKLAAQSEQLVSAVVTRKLPVRVGGVLQPAQPTRSIAAWVEYVTGVVGYSPTDLDLAELERLDAIWQARGDYYDNTHETSSTVKEVINAALRAGFAETTIDRGKIRPVRDEPRTTMESMYSPQNMTQQLEREFAAITPDDFDGVDVEYTSDRTWQVETVECRLPGDLGLRTEKISLEGVTSRTRAWRIGMRARRASKYRRFVYTFGTELDALNSRYLSYCALGDDVPGYSQSALLMGAQDMGAGVTRLTSSEPFDWSAGGAHVIGVRRADGTLSGPYPATQISDYEVDITGLDFDPDTSWQIEPPHLLFGPLNRWSYPVLITEITPNGTDAVSVKAINYDERVYADDDNAPLS